MKSMRRYNEILAFGISLFLIASCTENPFGGGDEISPGTRKMSGHVLLKDGASPENVYLWLEGFKIGMRTDSNGKFEIVLPPPASQGTPDGASGVFKLYYYVANYKLAQTNIAVRNGEFIYAQGEIDKNGELHNPKELVKILQIETSVTPDTLSQQAASTFDINITMQADSNETVIVRFPGSFSRPFGTVLFEHQSTGEVFLFGSNFDDGFGSSKTIGHVTQTKQMQISIVQGALPVGEYEVIPYLLLSFDFLPPGMIESLGDNVLEAGPEYLKLPFRRVNGRIVITE